MKILHSADLHLDTPFTGRSETQAKHLRQALLSVPEKLAALCRREGCDLMLLSGDLFDGPWTQESLRALCHALEEAEVPVFISPGNHDFCVPDSPYLTEKWPDNVHIFTNPFIESVTLPSLDCRIYGAGFRSMDCESLLNDFRLEGAQKHHIAVLHGDPTMANSPYNPITLQQIQHSELDYLALGHIHKQDQIRCGNTLCAWPGCPMGRGYDELGIKGALIVTIEDSVDVRFVPLDTPRFFDYEVDGADAALTMALMLPAVGDDNFHRFTLTGACEPLDLNALAAAYPQFPNLELRDHTIPVTDIWGTADEDSLEGVYFHLLKEAMTDANESTRQALTLAAEISRKILDGQEVVLP